MAIYGEFLESSANLKFAEISENFKVPPYMASTLRPGAARPTAVQGASPRLRRVREQKNRFAVFLQIRRMAAAQGTVGRSVMNYYLYYFICKIYRFKLKKYYFWPFLRFLDAKLLKWD